MEKIMRFFALLTCVVMFVDNSFCLADDSWQDKGSDMEIEGTPNMIGLGVAVREEPYKGMDTDALLFPMFVYTYERFYIKGAGVGFVLWESDVLSFDALVQPRWMGYDGDDSDFLKGMKGRKWSIDGGFELTWTIPELSDAKLSGSFVTDLLSEHEGQEATIKLSKKFKVFPIEGWPVFIEPGISVEWQSDDLVDYYYGVRSNEARANRAAYSPDDAINFSPSLGLYVPISEKWLIFAKGRIDFLDDEISDSPIVDEDYALKGVTGLAYLF